MNFKAFFFLSNLLKDFLLEKKTTRRPQRMCALCLNLNWALFWHGTRTIKRTALAHPNHHRWYFSGLLCKFRSAWWEFDNEFDHFSLCVSLSSLFICCTVCILTLYIPWYSQASVSMMNFVVLVPSCWRFLFKMINQDLMQNSF